MFLTLALFPTMSLGPRRPSRLSPPAIDTARDLYAAASYREALEALAKAEGTRPTAAVYEYQALCLLALGRKDEAVTALSKLVEHGPDVPGDLDALAPSVRELFESVRRETLPKAARRRFASAPGGLRARRLPHGGRGLRGSRTRAGRNVRDEAGNRGCRRSQDSSLAGFNGSRPVTAAALGDASGPDRSNRPARRSSARRPETHRRAGGRD